MKYLKKRNWIISALCLMLFIISQNCLAAKPFQREVSFEVENGKMYVQVLISMKPYRFLFDTGASGYGRIDSALVSELKLPITGTSLNSDGTNTSTINNVRVYNISFAGIEFKRITLYSRNYNRGNAKIVHGVIGRAYWKDYLLEIDYRNKKMVFSDRSLKRIERNTLSYDRPFVIPFKVGENEVRGHIDTGSPFTILFPMEYAKKGNVSELERAGSARSANTNFIFWKASFYDDIQVANNVEKNLEAVFSDVITHVNIGMGFLQNYHISIDQQKKLLRLKKFNSDKD